MVRGGLPNRRAERKTQGRKKKGRKKTIPTDIIGKAAA